MVAAAASEHIEWTLSVIVCIFYFFVNVLAVLQCSRNVSLMFVYSNQKDSLSGHCEL